MTDPVDVALEWGGIASLGPIWEELARRMGASDRVVRKIRVSGLDEQGRRWLASLLGLSRLPQDVTVTVDVARVGAALGLEDPALLRRMVERVRGPLGNRAAERASNAEARATLWRRTAERLAERTPLTFARIRAAGIPGGDLEAHGEALALLADCFDALPSSRAMPLPAFAWRVSGDPHALDTNTPIARYLHLGAAELTGRGRGEGEPDSIAARRALQELGVVMDRISFATITYGLRATPDSPLGRLLEEARKATVPLGLSGAMLDGPSPAWLQKSWLCVENPSVVEAAVLAGAAGPVVCTSGWPSIDAQRLLDGARAQGIELRYAGDYDATGLAIASFMIQRYGAVILMTRDRYLRADLGRAPVWGEGEVPGTPWDRALADAIREERRVVYQEDPAIFQELLGLKSADG
jgi:uncharacterized protein (TIGR02679 family)